MNRFEVQFFCILPRIGQAGFILINKDATTSAARQSFQPQRTGAAKCIKHIGPVQIKISIRQPAPRHQHVEN
jgi:hypothetical protein